MPIQRKEMGMVRQNADVHKIALRLKQVWTKLTDEEIAHYEKNRRSTFLQILQKKYHFTAEQAEEVLSNIERFTI